MDGQLEHDRRQSQGADADRQVDVEDPAPGQLVREEAADQRPGHARHSEDGADVALIAAALSWRQDVADYRHRHREDAARAEPLDAARHDQLRHVLGNAREQRAGDEDADRDLE